MCIPNAPFIASEGAGLDVKAAERATCHGSHLHKQKAGDISPTNADIAGSINRHPMEKKNNPIDSKEEVANNPDPNIDKDHPGFPHGQSKEELINPKTKEDKATANLDKKDETEAG